MSGEKLDHNDFGSQLPTTILSFCRDSPEYAGEIWQTAVTRLSSDKPPKNPRAWAKQATRNEIHRRKHRESKDRAKRGEHLDRLHDYQTAIRADEDPAEIVAEIDEKGFQSGKLKEWLPHLEQRERIALLASFSISGIPGTASLSKSWNCTDRNVRHLKQRALRKLRKWAEEECCD